MSLGALHQLPPRGNEITPSASEPVPAVAGASEDSTTSFASLLDTTTAGFSSQSDPKTPVDQPGENGVRDGAWSPSNPGGGSETQGSHQPDDPSERSLRVGGQGTSGGSWRHRRSTTAASGTTDPVVASVAPALVGETAALAGTVKAGAFQDETAASAGHRAKPQGNQPIGSAQASASESSSIGPKGVGGRSTQVRTAAYAGPAAATADELVGTTPTTASADVLGTRPGDSSRLDLSRTAGVSTGPATSAAVSDTKHTDHAATSGAEDVSMTHAATPRATSDDGLVQTTSSERAPDTTAAPPASQSAPAPVAVNAAHGPDRTAHSTPTLPGVASQLTQVIGPLRVNSAGTQSLTIALHPDGLGVVRATITVDQDQMFVRLAPSSGAGEDALRAALPELHASLTNDAAKPTLVELQTSTSGGNQAHPDQQFTETRDRTASPATVSRSDSSRLETNSAASTLPVGPQPTAAGVLLDLRL